MARKKKPFRNVRDKNFLAMSEMPLMENKNLVFEWMQTSAVMEYIFHQARNWKFVVSVYTEDDGYIWQGVNYGKENRNINREIKTAYGKKIFDALTKDEIDLMPPLCYKIPDEDFNPIESEVIQYLATKKNILQLAFITALYNGRIIRNEDGSWIGSNQLEKLMIEKEQ